MIQSKLEGGLGNNLFQMATVIAHSLRYGFEYSVPMKIQTPHTLGQVPYLSPNIKYCKDFLDLPVYKEQSFEFSEIPKVDNIILEGFWQSYLYFDEYREEILKAFNFNWERKRDYCSIHIRLGDYLDKLDCHPPVTKGYLFEAMMNVMTRVRKWEAVKFLVFSDSTNLAKEMLSSTEFQSFPIEYCMETNPIKALELMSSCQYNICSNSAFSWWAFYLNQFQDKIGVFPRVWFGKELDHDTSDLYLPNSIII